MARCRSTGNASTERRFRALLARARVRGWRLGHNSGLPGRPDIVFNAPQVAVFLDGCFWHGCQRCRSVPAQNRRFWVEKLRANALRDRRASRRLRAMGWRTLRIWEHQIRENPARAIGRVRALAAPDGGEPAPAPQRPPNPRSHPAVRPPQPPPYPRQRKPPQTSERACGAAEKTGCPRNGERPARWGRRCGSERNGSRRATRSAAAGRIIPPKPLRRFCSAPFLIPHPSPACPCAIPPPPNPLPLNLPEPSAATVLARPSAPCSSSSSTTPSPSSTTTAIPASSPSKKKAAPGRCRAAL